jgi:hypothetical protein
MRVIGQAYGAVMLWQYAALWGLAGGAVNRILIYLEAAQRVKGPPWRFPHGPGGGMYVASLFLHCAIAAVVTGAAGQAGYVPNAVVALGMGAAAPVVVKKLSSYTLAVLPKANDDQIQDEPDD